MRSIGIDLEPWIKQGLLHIHAARPTLSGLEMHLATMHKWINDVQPRAVVVDPISNFAAAGTNMEVKAMLIRLIDLLKAKQITTLFTNLTSGGGPTEKAEMAVSSLMDTWLLLSDIELGGERHRSLYILKSRQKSRTSSQPLRLSRNFPCRCIG
jgi:circadian clock protein KaiC